MLEPATPQGAAAMASGSRRLLRRMGVDLRKGETTAACLLFLCFFLIITFQYTAKTVRQSTFIDSLGAAKLPYVYLLVALGSYPVLRLYARFADRTARHHLIAMTCALVAASMAGFWWLYQFSWPWVPVAFYIWVSIIFVMTVSQFWSFTNHIFDPRQAKRLFGFVGAGGLLGGIAGGQVARASTNLVGTRYALLVAAAIIAMVVALIYLVNNRRPSSDDRVAGAGAGAAGLGKLTAAGGGFATIRQSRHLTLIATLLTLTVIVAQIVDLQFNWAVEQSTAGLDERTAFFGNFYSIMGIAAFVFQLLFAARIHRVLGVGFAMRVLPVTMAVGTGALFASAALFPAALVVSALVLKVGENGLRYSLDQATRELLFLPVPSQARIKAKAFIDVFVQRGAKGLAALLLLPVTFGIVAPVQAGLISFVLIAVWLGVTVAMHREYVASFRTGLKQRSMDTVVPINLSDVTTLEILVQSLGSTDSRQVLHSLDLLASHGRGNLVPPLLLYHDDATVRLEALKILALTDRRDAAPLVERRLGDDDPDVRAEAVRVLADFNREDACALMLPKLRESDPGVRAAAIACLTNHGDESMKAQARVALEDMLSDGDSSVRREAAKAIGAVHESELQSQLVQLLYDETPEVVREAISAVRRRVARDGFSPLYSPILISRLNSRRLKHEIRESLVAFGEPVIPALVHFMNDRQEQIWVRRALPKTLARIESPAAVRALAESLEHTQDSFLRMKLIEALGAPGPERVRPHAPLIEAAIRTETLEHQQAMVDAFAIDTTAGARLDGPLIRWDDDEQVPSLLDQLLAERMERHLNNTFGLLASLHSREHIWAAHRSLTSGQAALKNHALEYLDNTLSGEVRRNVFAMIDDAPTKERLRTARRLFHLAEQSRVQTLQRFLTRDGGVEMAGLTVAAMYEVYSERIADLYATIGDLSAKTENPFVRETASWVSYRLELSAGV